MLSTTLSTVQVKGLTLRVRTTPGPTSANPPSTPYVLVHGLGMTHRYLDRLREELSADADVHAVDLPGFGRDPRPEVHLGVEDQAALLLEAVAALGLGSCTLVGHSMGVQFVTEAAVQRPELVDRLVLIGPVADRRRRTVPQQALMLGTDSLRESPSANWAVFTDYLLTGIPWYLRQLREMMEYPLERTVERVRCPVLVLRGDRDPVAGAPWCRELAARAPQGSFVEIEGQPHVVQHSAASAIAAEIIAFRSFPRRNDAPFLLEASVGSTGEIEDRPA
jgi:pimeloyl-ACP methyl ester carboxylesterase